MIGQAWDQTIGKYPLEAQRGRKVRLRSQPLDLFGVLKLKEQEKSFQGVYKV